MNKPEIFERNRSVITGEENLKEVWNFSITEVSYSIFLHQ